MKKTTLQLLAYSTFTISLIFTVTLLSVNATTKFNMFLMACLGLCMELSKCFMLHLSIKQKNSFYKGISVALFMFSFIASISAFTNNKLNVVEKAKLSSPVYVATKKIIEEKRNYINKLDQILYRTKINNINQEIFNLELSLESINFKTGKGTSEVFNLIGVFLGVNGELLSLFFSIGMALVFELITVVFFYEFLKDEVAETPQEKVVLQEEIQNNKVVDFKGVTQEKTQEKVQEKTEEKTPYDLAIASIEKQKEKVMGFDLSDEKKTIKKTPKKTEKKDIVVEKKKERFSTQDLEKYVNFMYSDAKEKGHDIAPGFRTIAKNIKLTPYRCDKIRGHLETIGVIKPEGQQTKIIKWEE